MANLTFFLNFLPLVPAFVRPGWSRARTHGCAALLAVE